MGREKVPVIVRDYVNNKISRYSAISECSHNINMPASYISSKLNRHTLKPTVIVAGYCIVSNTDGIIKWPELNKEKAKYDRRKYLDTQRVVYGKNLHTGEIRRFKNKNEVYRQLGIHSSNILECLYGTPNQHVLRGWYFTYNRNINWSEITNQPMKYKKGSVISESKLTGDIIEFKNVAQASKYFKTRPRQISSRVKGITKSLWKEEWVFRYKYP